MENVLPVQVDVLAAHQALSAPNALSQPPPMETEHANVPMEHSSPLLPSATATNVPTTLSPVSV